MGALCGCSTHAPYVAETNEDVLARIKGPTAPLPAKTPFDGDAPARMMYLDWYQAGYNSGLGGGFLHMCYVPGPYPRAQHQGWSDGQAAGISVWIEKTLKPKLDSMVNTNL
jgi:hypothetical protein